jgi:uncharacterized protein YkwD
MSRTTIVWGCFLRSPLRKLAASSSLAVSLICAGSIASASAACLGEDMAPDQINTQAARDSVACLINEQRALHGLGPLAVNVNLQQAGQHHSKAMDKGNFLGHGPTLERVRRSGYLKGAGAWGVGEVIGWGPGGMGSPKSLVSAWMRSATHRRTLLTPGFQDLGVGIAKGSPMARGSSNAAIYTVDFGYRR